MLSFRILQLLTVGFCLLLIAKYMKFTLGTVRRLDRMMTRGFFNVEGLTDEIRERAGHARKGGESLMRHSIYRWLCLRLRKVIGLGPGSR